MPDQFLLAEPDERRAVYAAAAAGTGLPPKILEKDVWLGWPRIDVHYRSGTRFPEGATIHLTEPDGTPLAIEVETRGHVALSAGTGYGGSWTHGSWKGRNWVEGVDIDLTDPEVSAMIPFGLLDHVAYATIGESEGWGLFELGTFGRHDPSGFDDYGSVAP